MSVRRRKFSWVLGFVLVAVASDLAASRPAFGQDSAAAAEVLFNDARAAAEKGDFAAACPKLEESQRLDPGMGTLYHLANCYERIGRTASAWAAFRDVASQAQTAGQTARENDARQRAAALEKALSHVTIEVPNAPPGFRVERDGVNVGAAQWGSAMPLDPGAHAIVAKAPGKKEWKKTLAVAPQEAVVLRVPDLEDAPPESTPDPRAREAGREDGAAEPREGSTQKTIGLVVGGVGVAALGVGAVFGVLSMGHKSDVDKACDPQNGCSQAGADASKSAVRTGNASTGFFLAGALLAAGGVALFLTAPGLATGAKAGKTSRLRATPLMAPSLAGVGFSGSW